MKNIYQPLIEWHLKEANRLMNLNNGNSRNSLKLIPVPDGKYALVRTKDKIFIVNRKDRNYHTKDFVCISDKNASLFRKDAPSGALTNTSDDFFIIKYDKWNKFMDVEFSALKERYNEC